MKRLLCIVGSMNAGGAETFLMKIYRQLDKEKYQMDFAVAVDEKAFYDDEITSYGGRIFHITPKSKGALKNFMEVMALVRDNNYQYVLRTSPHSLSALELFAAKLGGADVRVFRSSNSNTTTGSAKERLLHRLFFFMPRYFSNVKFAPSTEAAEFLFGKGCVTDGTAFILHNAIDYDRYKFNSESREKLRRELKIDGKKVVGHVGRLSRQKNHDFLLDFFAQYAAKDVSAVLLLIGEGELDADIRDKIAGLSLTDRVLMLGVRPDIPALLSAMDVFVLPSLYEGLPNVVVEAQASGLPCLVSDRVTKEVDITGIVSFLPIDDAGMWAQEIESALSSPDRRDTFADFVQNKYDIKSVAEEFVARIFGDC